MSLKITNTSASTVVPASGGNGTKPTPVVPDHELIRCIGQGGYGEVWLARNALGSYRAVKVVYRLSFKDERVYEREFHGIQMFEPISRSNDGLLDILQAGRNDAAGYYYYVMELADDSNASEDEAGKRGQGEREQDQIPSTPFPSFSPANYCARTLQLDLQRRGRLPPSECVQLALNLTLALGHLHRHGLIHRDIKPANIIFVHGIPKLADIGLVTAFDETCSFVGTEGFIAPEGPTSPRADLFSLGKVLYEISTGKDRKDFPEPATGLGEQEDQALNELNAVILKACASDPQLRYQTSEEFHADLALLQSGKSVRWKRVVERRLDFARKTLAVVGVIAVLATAGYFFQRQQTRAVERNLYAANMNLAQRDWDKANPGRLSQLLGESEAYPDKGFEWYYWQRQLHLDLKTIRGHVGEITSVAYSPDGQRILTGSADQTARVWDVATGQPLLLIQGHGQEVTSAAYSSDGQRIVTASLDGTARIWDASTGKPVLDLAGHTGSVFAAAFSHDVKQIVTASKSTNGSQALTVAVWDASSGAKLRVLEEKSLGHGLSAVAFSRDGQRIAAIIGRWAVKIWETSSGRELLVPTPYSEFFSLAFSPDGKRLLTGSGRVAVWDASSGEQLLLLQGGNERGQIQVAYSPDGKKLVTAGRDQRAILWDATTGKELFRLTGHRGTIGSVAFSPDSQSIATASADGTVKIWDANQARNPRTLPNLTKQVSMLAISPDGKRVATTMWDKTVRITDLATGRELLVLTGHPDGVNCVAFSHDGKRIATGNGWKGPKGKDRAKIWDASTGQELLALNGSGLVAFSPDSQRICTSSGMRAATIWNASTGSKLVELNGHSQWVHGAAFSPDGKRIVTSSEDWTVKLWDAASGRELLTIQRPKHGNQNISRVTFSPDGQRIALADNDPTPRIWDASTGRESLVLSGHIDPAVCISWSPDGRRILTSGYDRSAKVWDALTGRELLTLEGHALTVAASAFSPNGRSIVTAGFDGLTKIWEAASDAQVAAWREEEKATSTLLKAPIP